MLKPVFVLTICHPVVMKLIEFTTW